jgi:alpha-L-rhamnosidase
VSVYWVLEEENRTGDGIAKGRKFTLDVVVPPTTTMEVVLPSRGDKTVQVVGSGKWSFSCVV